MPLQVGPDPITPIEDIKDGDTPLATKFVKEPDAQGLDNITDVQYYPASYHNNNPGSLSCDDVNNSIWSTVTSILKPVIEQATQLGQKVTKEIATRVNKEVAPLIQNFQNKPKEEQDKTIKTIKKIKNEAEEEVKKMLDEDKLPEQKGDQGIKNIQKYFQNPTP